MRRFKEIMGLFPTGVSVVTTVDADGEAYGLTVSSFVSLSLSPPLILFCLDNRVSGMHRFRLEQAVLVSFLAENQKEISEFFATPGSDRSWASPYIRKHPDSKLPALPSCYAEIQGKISSIFPGGDHTILLVEVAAAGVGTLWDEGMGPLIYFRGRYDRLSSGRELK
jgi:flavin reductase (DIM6/NTAB) family NADH-FMN oxidoreductase RutF